MKYIRNQIRNRLIIEKLSRENGFLDETGWIKSLECRMPVDKNGKPVPWFTIPFIYFLEERLKKEMTVFEYGSGNSTLYLSSRVSKVLSLEHDRAWYEKLKNNLPSNVMYFFKPINEGYSDFINTTDEKFDIVIIDGRKRVECAKNSISRIKENGVIIWDNSLRQKYMEGLEYMLENGFKRIDFKGLNLGGTVLTVTSIFYRGNNCFNI